MIEALQFDFIQNALAAGLLASIICGIIGTLVVVNRIVFLSGGIAHAAYGGIGLSFYFQWPYLPGAIGFSLLAGMLMAAVSHTVKHRADTIVGVIWAVGMAFGIILLDLTPGYNVDLMSYLFGSILTVPASDLWVMLVVGVLITVLVFLYYPDLLAMSYDEEFAKIRGVPVKALYFGLIGIALLTIPPFIVEKYAKSLAQMMVGSSILGSVFTLTGLWLSYQYNLTSGATIIMVSGAAFILSLLVDRIGFNGKKRKGM